MEVLYFLSFIGLCAVSLVWYAIRSWRPVRKSPVPKTDIWSQREKHAHIRPPVVNRANGRGYTISANKISFDGEVEEDQDIPAGSMTEIEYTPEETRPPKSSNLKS